MLQEDKKLALSQGTPHPRVDVDEYEANEEMYKRHYCPEHAREIQEVCENCLKLLCSGCGTASRRCCPLGDYIQRFTRTKLLNAVYTCSCVVYDPCLAPGSIHDDLSSTAEKVKKRAHSASKTLGECDEQWLSIDLENIKLDGAFIDKMEAYIKEVREVAAVQVCYTVMNWSS